MEDNIRTFSTRAVLADLDRKHSPFFDYDGSVCVNDVPVPVVSEDGHQIGWGTVYVRGSKLFADLNIDYHSSERLLIESGEKVWALSSLARETADERKMDALGEDIILATPVPVVWFEVTDIRLATGIKPGDPTLPPVGSLVL